MLKRAKQILVTGGTGFIGSHLTRKLEEIGCEVTPSGSAYDLTAWDKTRILFDHVKPDVVFHLAGHVGGILANRRSPGTFWRDNLLMGVNVLEACRINKVKKLIMSGTTCSYPCHPPSLPFREENLFDGYPEKTNAPYGLAKRALLSGCQTYREEHRLDAIYLIPTNAYGPGDHFEGDGNHVIPALIKKIAEAKDKNKETVEIWGTGKATRTFIYVEDLADAFILGAEKYSEPDPINLAINESISIGSLANLIGNIIGFRGTFHFDASKPDGQPVRSLDCSKAREKFGFKAKTYLEDGLRKTISWYLGKRG